MSKKDTFVERKQTASRLRQVREDAGFTQEQFSEVLGVSLSAYKKIESSENGVSLFSLRRLYEEMNVSTDFILYGEYNSLDDVWKAVLNCSEKDKMYLFIRMLMYFTEIKKGTFPLKDEQSKYDIDITQFIKTLQGYGED